MGYTDAVMKRQRTIKERVLFFLLPLLLLLVAGCGSKEKDPLDTYREEMETFYADVARIDTAIDAIDADSEDAPAALLGYLDELRDSFDKMAQVEVPEEFAAMGDLPQEASDYMDRAVAAYHEAYDEAFDEEAEALAEQYYERANIRIRYMLAILHGDTEEIEQELTGPQG